MGYSFNQHIYPEVKSMHVLWISPGFASDEQDDGCIPPLQLLAGALKARGVDVQILTLAYPFSRAEYVWHGIQIKSGYGWNRRWFRWINWMRVIRFALQWHRIRKFDIIHSFWLGPSWLIGHYLHWKWRVPQVTTLMGQDVLKSNFYLKLLNRSRAKALVAVSHYQNLQFKKNTGFSDLPIISWGLALPDDSIPKSSLRLIDILGCGSLVPVKNWDVWLQVVDRLLIKFPDLKIEIIGEGPELKLLQLRIAALKLQNKIRLLGKLPRSQVLKKMADAKILLHTAHFESFGMVLLEAAANGCQVISTPVGIAPEIAACGDTVDELVHLSQEALENPNTKYLPKVHTTAETSAGYIKLYTEFIDRW